MDETVSAENKAEERGEAVIKNASDQRFHSNTNLGDSTKSGDKGERAFAQRDASETAGGVTNEHPDQELRSDDADDCEVVDDDDVSSVLSDDCIPRATEDESHYITTHEIQLSELSDHERDCENDVCSSSASWDAVDEHQVYTFVDYTSLDTDCAVGGMRDGRQPRAQGAAAVSTLLESDLRKFASSDERLSKAERQEQEQEQERRGAGQVRPSTGATSKAINDPGSTHGQENLLYCAKRPGDVRSHALSGGDGNAETPSTSKCFIAVPGRVHLGSKLRGREVTEYSSGTSSAVSELDDADKEVRNLTARAFKSLAHPYLDAIHFSTSSESSASERGVGLNSWSAFVDVKYGNVSVDKNSAASFEKARNIDNKGCGYKSIKPPTSDRILALSGDPHGAHSSTKKIELMGKFGQGHGGVIRLTETLNFRCNVKSGEPRGGSGAGSRSTTDEVTKALLSAQRRAATKPPPTAMEGAHKKAIFASSLIKNVISKKMQFEQERKMERGEISEPQQTPSPCFTHHDTDLLWGKGSRDAHGLQSSKLSEGASELAIMCADELGDFVDSGSSDARSDSRRHDAPRSNLATEAGIDAKKGALEASNSALLRSQNSAFRRWKDEEVGAQKDHKTDRADGETLVSADCKESEADLQSDSGSKLTKMSHLFVPSIQMVCSDEDGGQQLRSGDDSAMKARSTGTAASKSPEIKINLRSNKTEPFGVSRLRAPNIGCNAGGLARTDDFKCQALAAALKGECADKVPHFMVRDIRDNKGKLQAPIYQVRDVRKLVKSSYHFVSLDNKENKTSSAPADSHPEQNKLIPHRNPPCVSPIVIKCHSVNTNSNGKQPETVEVNKGSELGSPEGIPEQKTVVGEPTGASANPPEESAGLKIESMLAAKRQDKISDVSEKKPESKMANQVALEKIQAAVKTMEQLYLFEKNEWKRKNEPHLLTDSHVLSLIASEELGGAEEEVVKGSGADHASSRDSCPSTNKTPAAAAAAGNGSQNLLRAFPVSSSRDEKAAVKLMQTTCTTGGKNMFNLSSSIKTPQPSGKSFAAKSPKLPMSLKINQVRPNRSESVELKEVDRSPQELAGDSENYLTIPMKSHLSKPSVDRTSVHTFSNQSHPTTPPGHTGSASKGQEDRSQTPKHSSVVMEPPSPEIPSATIYHSLPLGLSTSQPQVYCFSPAIAPAPTLDPFQATQRKMLLDPTTGSYYLVDTPVQPTTKRLFDPETGQYVDVPMPQPPMTPMPMPISPLAFSPGAFGHTYMVYPGLMPAPSVITARALVPSQMSLPSEAGGVDKASLQQAEGMYMESPFYMATGKTMHATSGAQQHGVSNTTTMSMKQPIISITSQQGPRIIAPPSFDGTTMSFVVEHR
ncbi:uncharacterized protein C4orf54 homolog [Pholidichthys leucotaenia]